MGKFPLTPHLSYSREKTGTLIEHVNVLLFQGEVKPIYEKLVRAPNQIVSLLRPVAKACPPDRDDGGFWESIEAMVTHDDATITDDDIPHIWLHAARQWYEARLSTSNNVLRFCSNVTTLTDRETAVFRRALSGYRWTRSWYDIDEWPFGYQDFRVVEEESITAESQLQVSNRNVTFQTSRRKKNDRVKQSLPF